MNIAIAQKSSRDNKKIWYYLEWGKHAGQRKATGIFTYAKPKDQLQKNHNKEAIAILQTKQSQMVLERQAVGSNYIPAHLLKSNFLDFYSEYVKANKKAGSRNLEGKPTKVSLQHLSLRRILTEIHYCKSKHCLRFPYLYQTLKSRLAVLPAPTIHFTSPN